MSKKVAILENLEKGKRCENCSFSYTAFSSKEEFNQFKIDSPGSDFVNRCGSKIRKKLNLPRDFTCEQWSNTGDTYGADFRAGSKLSDKKDLEDSEIEDEEDEETIE